MPQKFNQKKLHSLEQNQFSSSSVLHCIALHCIGSMFMTNITYLIPKKWLGQPLSANPHIYIAKTLICYNILVQHNILFILHLQYSNRFSCVGLFQIFWRQTTTQSSFLNVHPAGLDCMLGKIYLKQNTIHTFSHHPPGQMFC